MGSRMGSRMGSHRGVRSGGGGSAWGSSGTDSGYGQRRGRDSSLDASSVHSSHPSLYSTGSSRRPPPGSSRERALHLPYSDELRRSSYVHRRGGEDELARRLQGAGDARRGLVVPLDRLVGEGRFRQEMVEEYQRRHENHAHDHAMDEVASSLGTRSVASSRRSSAPLLITPSKWSL